MTLRAIILELINDRLIQAGTGASSVSLLGAKGLEFHPMGAASLASVQPWVAFFAALFGGLSAAAVFAYTCIKIWRLLKVPSQVE